MLNLYNITIEAVLNEDPQERSSEVSPDLVQMRLLVLWGLHPIWGPGPGLQGFRAEPETATQVMESLGGAESDRGGLHGEGVWDPGDFPGSRLGFGSEICRALSLFAAVC